MLGLLRQSVVILVLLTILCGIVYPLAVTGIAQLVFPHQANGSLIVKDVTNVEEIQRDIYRLQEEDDQRRRRGGGETTLGQ